MPMKPPVYIEKLVPWVVMALILAACVSSGGGQPGERVPQTGAEYQPTSGGGGATVTTVTGSSETLLEAIEQSYTGLLGSVKAGANVALISVAAEDMGEGEFALEELMLLMVNSKRFRVVDRRSIDVIRAEQNFQLSGDVDDETAVSIGHLTGAEIVITGSIAAYDTAKYLRFKALSVETGQIIAMTSQRYEHF